jgi:hypothetical protein
LGACNRSPGFSAHVSQQNFNFILFYQNMHNLNKSAERKISQKNPEEMFIVMQQQFKFVHCDHAIVQSEWNEVIL